MAESSTKSKKHNVYLNKLIEIPVTNTKHKLETPRCIISKFSRCEHFTTSQNDSTNSKNFSLNSTQEQTKNSNRANSAKYLGYLKQCAVESRQIFAPKTSNGTSKANPVTASTTPKIVKFTNANHSCDVNLKCKFYESNVFFDRQVDSATIRERYRKEIDTLRDRLHEMRKQKGTLKTSVNIKNLDNKENTCNENKSSANFPSTSFDKETLDSAHKTKTTEFFKFRTAANYKSDIKPKRFFNFTASLKSKMDVEIASSENDNNGSKSTKIPLLTDNSKMLFGPKSNTSVQQKVNVFQIHPRYELKTPVQLVEYKMDTNRKYKLQKLWATLPSCISLSCDTINSGLSNKSVKDETTPESEIAKEETDLKLTEIKVFNEEGKKQIIVEEDIRKTFEGGDFKSCYENWPVRQSLFPHVPPYWSFSTSENGKPVKVDVAIKKLLKWKLTNITPILVRKTIYKSGFQLSYSTNDWVGTWGKHMKSSMYQTLKDWQKLNHFPGTYHLGRKDRLWKNVQLLADKFGQNQFGFMPYTYLIPGELILLKNDWMRKDSSGGNGIWIVKPPASARGIGIKVINKYSDLPRKSSRIVQLYVSQPYLINGNKFDVRLYVLLTSFCPLRIYLWPEGLARFASSKYNDNVETLSDRFIHLTNYSINRFSTQYTTNDDVNACQGHKWTLSKLWEYLQERGVDTDALWKTFQDIVIKAMISSERFITPLCLANTHSRYNCYELFGIDILLDDKLKAWLIEINISPSLHSASPLDTYVKAPLIKTMLDIVQFHVPPTSNNTQNDHSTFDIRLYTSKLTKKEKSKHFYYKHVGIRKEYLEDILTDLTRDDIRHLILSEDEYNAKGKFERIFPTEFTYTYLNFMEPRYYNRLFDAWENRYGGSRITGISRLQRLCAERHHLRQSDSSITSRSLIKHSKD